MNDSKVVHCRISLKTLASCVLLLQKMGIPVKGISFSTLVAQSLSGLLSGVERQQLIDPVEDITQAVEVLRAIAEVTLPSPIYPITDDFTEESATNAEPYVKPDLSNSINAILNQTSTGNIKPVLTEPSTQEVERERVPVSLEDQEGLTFEKIEEEAKKDDMLVELVRGHERGELALGIVYKNLSKDMWDTETAKQLLIQLVEDENNG